MIIPTPEFDPLFADDGVPFQSKMIEYIKREFADVLGPRVALLDCDDGLDALAERNRPRTSAAAERKAA